MLRQLLKASTATVVTGERRRVGGGGNVRQSSRGRVKGHQELPGDGHEICPLVAIRSAR